MQNDGAGKGQTLPVLLLSRESRPQRHGRLTILGIDQAFAGAPAGHLPPWPPAGIDRLAVVNDNTNDVAATTFVLPWSLGSDAAKWPNPSFPGGLSRPVCFRLRIRRFRKDPALCQDRPDSIAGRAGGDSRSGPE